MLHSVYVNKYIRTYIDLHTYICTLIGFVHTVLTLTQPDPPELSKNWYIGENSVPFTSSLLSSIDTPLSLLWSLVPSTVSPQLNMACSTILPGQVET